MIDYLAYIAVRILSFIFIILPLRCALCIGRGVGIIFYYINLKKRSTVYKNLRLAFSYTHSPKELKKIAKGFYKNFGQNLVEMLFVPKIDKAYMKRYINVENLNYIDESIEKGKGAILLSFHFGSWEVSHLTCSLLGYPFTILVKPQKRFDRLSKLLESYRQDKGCMAVETGIATREILKRLKNNQIIGMVADQSGRDGMQIPFISKTASLPTGAVRFALKLGTPIILAFIIRAKGPYHHIILKEPLYLQPTGSLERDTYNNLIKIKAIAEGYIKLYPQQYFWLYKVWKYSQERSIIILSDGKAGHLRQMESVLGALKGSKYKIDAKIIEVSFRNKIAKVFFNICVAFTKTKYCRGNFRYLKWALVNSSYEKLISSYADMFISCGSSLAAVNLIVSGENNARSVVIMKPDLLPIKRFGLAIIPRHDNPPLKPNIVVTEGALNLIDDEYLTRQSEKLRSKIKLQDGKLKIGLLLGGDTRDFFLKREPIQELLRQIKSLASQLDAELLITTSRRTPKEIEELVKSEFKDYQACKLLVIANENNILEAVGGILGTSQIIITSPDSISMVSEAASSGRYVIVFDIKDCDVRLAQKHRRFLMKLSQEGYINFVDYKNIKDTLIDIWRKKPEIKILNDRERIKEPILKLF